MEASSTTGDIMEIIDPGSNKASSATNHKEAILNCCICRKTVSSKKAKLLPCLHTLCSPCEITAMTEGRMTCLFCNQSCNSSEITDNFLVQYLDIGTEQIKCDSCSDNSLAKYKCDDCSEYLCVECGRAHQRVKVTKDHQLKEIDVSTSGDDKCSIHSSEDLSWYCMTCDEVTCRNCQLEKHANHRYCSFEEHSQNFRNELNRILDENRKHITNLSQIINLADQRVKEVANSEKVMRMELHKAMSQIQEALTERGKFLLNNINTASDTKRRTYLDVKNAAENIDSLSRQVNFFIEASLESNSRLALRLSRDVVVSALEKIENLKKERRSAVNILQMQVQLSLGMSKSTDIVNQLQQLGDFVVDRPPQILSNSVRPKLQQPNQSSSNSVLSSMISVPQTGFNLVQRPQQQIRFNSSQVATPIAKPQQPAPPQPHVSQPTSTTVQRHHLQQEQQRPQQHLLQQQQQQQQQQSYHSSKSSTMVQQRPLQQLLQPLYSGGPQVVQYHPAVQSGQVTGQYVYSQNPDTFVQRVPVPMQPNQQRMPVQNSQLYLHTNQTSPMVPVSQGQRISGNHPLSHMQQQYMRLVDPNQPHPANYYQQMMPPPSYVTVSNAGPIVRVTLPPPSAAGLQHSSTTTPQFCKTADPPSLNRPQVSSQPPANFPPPPLQYGPSRVPHVQQSAAPNLQPAIPVQRVPSPVLFSNLPAPTIVNGQQNYPTVDNSDLSRKRKASGDSPLSSVKHLSPRPVNQVPLIQLSPTPEESQSTDTDVLMQPEQELIITNVISISNRNKNLQESATAKEQCKHNVAQKLNAACECTDCVPSSSSSESAATVPSKPDPDVEKSSNDSNVSYQPPAKVSRLARKSIAKICELDLNETVGNGEHREPAMEEGSMFQLKDKELQKPKSPYSRPASYLDDFPMTQPFIPSVDEDDALIFNIDSAPSSFAQIIPLVAQNGVSQSAIVNGNSTDNRATPNATEVTTSCVDDNRWEDYCSVCQNGGDLMCCEGTNCTRVFHCYDHIPQYSDVPKYADQWICTFCVNPKEFKSSEDDIPADQRKPRHLTNFELKCCERILLELYCHHLSEPFHNPVEGGFIEYYQTIQNPIDFSIIRSKLNQSSSSSSKYVSVEDFLSDLNRLFINCDTFNEKDSEIGKAGKIVGAKYRDLVNEYFPEMMHMVQTVKINKSRDNSREKKKRRRVEIAGSDSEDSSYASSVRSTASRTNKN